MSCVGLAGVVMLEINNGLPLATDVHATSLLDAPLSIPEQGPSITNRADDCGLEDRDGGQRQHSCASLWQDAANHAAQGRR